MPLKICFKNIVKIVCYYHFSKKKKKKMKWNCGNGIAKIGGKKKLWFMVMPLPK